MPKVTKPGRKHPKKNGAVQTKLRLPQIRILRVLSVGTPAPALTRAKLCERIGISAISGTITAALNGRDSYGASVTGLVPGGLVSKEELKVPEDGINDTVYEITDRGRKALAGYAEAHKRLPKLREKDLSINRRYKRKVLKAGA